MTEKKKKLTAKQQAFVNEYCIDKNATQAAIRAGYSENTAYAIGQNLLRKIEISQAIDLKLQKAADECTVTLERVIKRYAEFAFANVDLADLKPSDSLKALDSLMRHLGGFANDSLTVNASEGLTELLQAATNMGHILPKEAEKREERLHS